MEFTAEEKKIWEELRNSTGPTNWIIVEFDDTNIKTAKFVESGTGGYTEFISKLGNDKVYYGVFRLMANVEGSDTQRSKFVFVTWTGEKVKMMQKAKVGFRKTLFANLFSGCHVGVQAMKLEEISKEEIEKLLNNASGAHKPTSYSW